MPACRKIPNPLISKKGLAVVVIDMQDFFLETRKKASIIPKQVEVLLWCEEVGVPVALVEFAECDQTVPPLQEIASRISAPVFVKRKADAFSITAFEEWLLEKKIETILVMGVDAGVCVLATTKSAQKKGYTVVTSHSVIAGYAYLYASRSTDIAGSMKWYSKNTCIQKDIMQFLRSLE